MEWLLTLLLTIILDTNTQFIKGAFLSDTDDTNVTGSELVTNGTFDSNTSSWTTVLEQHYQSGVF